MFCPNCGTQMADGVKFCPKCGNLVAQASQPTRVEEHVSSSADGVDHHEKPRKRGLLIGLIVVGGCLIVLGIGFAFAPSIRTWYINTFGSATQRLELYMEYIPHTMSVDGERITYNFFYPEDYDWYMEEYVDSDTSASDVDIEAYRPIDGDILHRELGLDLYEVGDAIYQAQRSGQSTVTFTTDDYNIVVNAMEGGPIGDGSIGEMEISER